MLPTYSSPKTRALLFTLIGCGALIQFCLLVASIFLLISILRPHKPSIRTSPGRMRLLTLGSFHFHSTKPFQEVRVPFSVEDDNIYLPVVLAGKHTKAILDTGNPGTLIWPYVFQLPGRFLTGGITLEAADGHPRQGELISLSSIRIGTYELNDTPTIAVNKQKPEGGIGHIANRRSTAYLADTTPILGNSAFAEAVLTIDYRHKQIILHNRDYPIMPRKLPEGAQLIDFKWVGTVGPFKGCPVVAGNLAGHPISFTLDTGWGGLAIGGSFSNRYFAADKYPRFTMHTVLGSGQEEVASGIHGSVAGIPFDGEADLYRKHDFGSEAMIGYQFLKDFRVTFDYPHQKVLLEPANL